MLNKGTKIKLVLKSLIRRKTFFSKGYKRSSFGIDFRYLSARIKNYVTLLILTMKQFYHFAVWYQTSTWIQKLFLAMTVTSGVVVSLPQTLCLITEYQPYWEVKILSLINRVWLCISLEKKIWFKVVTVLDYQPCIWRLLDVYLTKNTKKGTLL